MPGASRRPRVALICPTNWDRLQLPGVRARLERHLELVPYGPDAEADPGSFDANAFVDRATHELARLRVAGVVSSSDYPGCLVASVVAKRLGLPGSAPAAVLRAAHKYYARVSLAQSVPEATPRFELVDPVHLAEGQLSLDFPVFVKPVKSWFSQLARRVDSLEQLMAYAASPEVRQHLRHFVRPLNQLLAAHSEFDWNGAHLLAEQVLVGPQVTVEGYVFEGRTTVLTFVDSDMYPGTGSFARFALPSRVTPDRAARMTDITDRAVRGLGITHGLFNVELIYDPASDEEFVVEVNPRMCGQFADLTEHVTGLNTYQILCDLGLGRRPPRVRRRHRPAAAASYPLRHFGDATVVSVPGPATVERVRRRTAATLIAVYYESGDQLSSRGKHFDGASYRYATVNVVGRRRSQLDGLAQQVERALDLHLLET